MSSCEETVKKAIKDALDIVREMEIPPDYKLEAFPIVLSYLLVK